MSVIQCNVVNRIAEELFQYVPCTPSAGDLEAVITGATMLVATAQGMLTSPPPRYTFLIPSRPRSPHVLLHHTSAVSRVKTNVRICTHRSFFLDKLLSTCIQFERATH